MLEIIPAIDVKDGQAVRLRRGDFATAERVAEDPIATAREFADAGAPRLHIVDLDGARLGTPQNSKIIAEIVRRLDIPVQVGGGLRSLESVRDMRNLGANRVVVGTSAAVDSEFAAALLGEFGDFVIVGADMLDGRIAVRGWTETTTERVEAFGVRLAGLGACRFLLTDVGRDGLLTGNNVAASRELALATKRPVLASGGVASIHDIEALAQVQPDGVEGVIIGKALYAGHLRLEDALAVARSAAE